MAEQHRRTHLLAFFLACMLAGRCSPYQACLGCFFWGVYWFVDLLICWFVGSLARFVGVLVGWCLVVKLAELVDVVEVVEVTQVV